MNLISADAGKYVFALSQREKLLFLELLRRYPVITKPYQPLSKTADAEAIKTDQELLDHALAADKLEHKKALDKLLGNSELFKDTDSGHNFTLDSSQVEWLLQVLNDIRVGSWRLLGSPDETGVHRLHVTGKNVPHVWAMEVAGFYQSTLIAAINGTA